MPNLWVTPDELGRFATSPYAYEACTIASFILWGLSGRKYSGTRQVTETYELPCQPKVSTLPGQGTLFGIEPYIARGVIRNTLSGGCDCGGSVRHTRLRLRGRPVVAVQRVVSGGVVVDPGDYVLVNRSTLQEDTEGALELDGIQVTYTYGVAPPQAGRNAARHLAEQFILGWDGSEECQLPERVTSVSRQGVSYTLLDEQSFLDDLRTGIYSVDLFLRTVNPDRARRRSKVFSPDLPISTRRRVSPLPDPSDVQIVDGFVVE